MPAIDVIDSTWVGAPPAVLARAVADPGNWRRWWPGLELAVDELRGRKGVRWSVRSVAESGDIGLTGTAEVWLEPVCEGSVAHFFLRLDPAPGALLTAAGRDRVAHRYRCLAKSAFWGLADQLDPGRIERMCARPAG
ncbi:MAG TPA: SRPBCC family protein [Jatrophihabitans sp.]|nr:SRPBCC family protein [Jatrophihabitans sp.]